MAILHFFAPKSLHCHPHYLICCKVKDLILELTKSNVSNKFNSLHHKKITKTGWCKIFDFQYICIDVPILYQFGPVSVSGPILYKIGLPILCLFCTQKLCLFCTLF